MSKSKYDFHRNLAVIIGINNYLNGIPELETPVADAEKLATILQETYQYEVQILLNEKATLLQLTSLLADLKQKTLHLPEKTLQIEESDRLIFYFAGHGIVPADGLENRDNLAGYLVPQDARGDILLQKQIEINKILVPMQDLHDALVELPCRHLLVILDCCFAGAFRSSLYREIVPARKVYKQRYDRFIRDRAWQAIASAAHDQKAIDYLGCFGQRGTTEDNKHSPFAEALFAALRGAADTIGTGDGIITATELYCYVRDQVEELTDKLDKRQTPGLFPLKKHDKGEYIFLLPNFDQNKLENAPALNEENNPYRGLKSYEEQHSQLFFGRDELIKQLYERVLHPKNPLTVVLGVSGSGKSSLVKAGLIPYIRANHNEDWCIIPTFRPGESPFAVLAEVIAVNTEVSGSNIEVIKSLSQTLIQAPRQFIDVVANVREIPTNAKLLLVIDQFEELITICKQQEREQFLNFLAQVLEANAQKLHIIITLRSDFEPRFLDSALKPYWSGDRFPVRAMRSDELRQAIERPANEKMLDFDPPNLVDLLIDEVGQMPGSLSLLSFTLSELYTKCIERESRTLTQADYQELGGVAGSLTHRATEIHNKLDKAQQFTMQRVMLRMVTIEGGESARRRVPLSELIYINDAENTRVEEIRQLLDKARLIVGGQEPGGEPYVEPAHDALVRGWSKLQEWKNEEQENLLMQQRLTPAANDWDRNNRPIGLLLPDGDRLNQLEKIKALPDNWFNQRESEFIQASIDYRELQNKKTREQQTRTELLRKADQVEDIIRVQAEQGLLLTIQIIGQNLEVLPQEILTSVQDSLHQALEIGQIPVKSFRHETEDADFITFSPDGQMIATVSYGGQGLFWDLNGNLIGDPFEGNRCVAFSPDGRMIVSSYHGEVKLWNTQGNPIDQSFKNQEDEYISVIAFSPNGQLIVGGGNEGKVRLWDLNGNLICQPFQAYPKDTEGFANIECLVFSPDGQIIASGGSDATVRLWDLKGKAITQPFQGHIGSDFISSIAFSPDGQLIVSGCNGGQVKLWDLKGNLIAQPSSGLSGSISSVAFSPDGLRIGIGTLDNAWHLWELQSYTLSPQFKIYQAGVECVAFSPNGQVVATCSNDRAIHLWDIRSNQIGQPLHEMANSVAFSPDGQYIVSGSEDGKLRLWDLQGNQIGQSFDGHKASINSVAFSPDGQYILSGSGLMIMHGGDCSVRRWNITGEAVSEPFQGHSEPVTAIAVSPDGNMVVSGSDDDTIRLWNMEGNPIGKPFHGHESSVKSVAFSPNGQLIASASWDHTVRLWDLKGNPIGQPFQGHDEFVVTVAFSPDSQIIASGCYQGTVRLWDLQGNPIGQPFQGDMGSVFSLAFSPDGKTIVTGCRDQTVRLWDLQGNPICSPLRAHKASVKSVAFSPDGKTIVSSSEDGTIRFWRGSWRTWLEVCCDRLRYHPVFKNSQTEVEKQAWETCQNYVWKPEKGAQKLYEQARKRIEEEKSQPAKGRNFSAAIAILNLVIQFNPAHADAYYHRGKCYAEWNNNQKTTEDFKEAATLYRQQGKTETEEYQEVMKFLV